MKKYIPYVVIIAIGAFAGNMINIGLSYGLHWQSLEPVAFMESFAIDFPLLLAPTMVTLLPAFLGSIYLFFTSPKGTQTRRYWSYVVIALLIVNVQTAGYHLPLNLKFMDQSIAVADVASNLSMWLFMHWVRVVITLCSAVFALKAYDASRVGQHKNNVNYE